MNLLKSPSLHRAAALAGAAALLGGALVACSPASDPSGDDADANSLFDQAAADLLPEGTTEIHIATGPGYPPFLDVADDGTTLTGAQIEQLRLLGEVLGVDIVMDDIKFDAVIPAMESGKTDGAAMAMSITAERLESVDFVSDYLGGTSLLVAAGNPTGITLDTMCGHTVAVQKGSVYADVYMPEFVAKCAADGEPEIEVSTFQTAADAVLALSSGRVEATMNDLAPSVYQASQSGGTLEALDVNYDPSLWGLALAKGSPYGEAFVAAMNHLIETGAYLDNLERFGVEAGAIEKSELYTSADQLD
jgi:polar amino acid transport system substrate-binding protein